MKIEEILAANKLDILSEVGRAQKQSLKGTRNGHIFD